METAFICLPRAIADFRAFLLRQIQNVLCNEAALDKSKGFLGPLMPTDQPVDDLVVELVEEKVEEKEQPLSYVRR